MSGIPRTMRSAATASNVTKRTVALVVAIPDSSSFDGSTRAPPFRQRSDLPALHMLVLPAALDRRANVPGFTCEGPHAQPQPAGPGARRRQARIVAPTYSFGKAITRDLV